MVKLPPRLAKVAEFIPPGQVVADIGTDHALLPLYLLEKGRAAAVIAVEAKDKPLQKARWNLQQHPLGSRVDVRLGSGLTALKGRDGVEVAVIAGMGNATIQGILHLLPPELDRLDLFVLQPMTRPDELRAWLSRHGFVIVDEALARDEGRIYEIFLAARREEGGGESLPFGERLLENRDPLLGEYIALKIRKTRLVLDSLARSRRRDREERAAYFAGELEKLERLMDIVSQGT